MIKPVSSSDSKKQSILINDNKKNKVSSVLSENTIKLLKKYGINVSEVKSESEAKELITKAENALKKEKTVKNNLDILNVNPKSEEDFFSQVKSFAEVLTVPVSEDDTAPMIISGIQYAINTISGIDKSLAEFSQQKLDTLSSNGIKFMNKYSGMNQVANNNKIVLKFSK